MFRNLSTMAAVIAASFITPALAQNSTDTLVRLSCVAGQVPQFNGTEWVCANLGGGGGFSFVLKDMNDVTIGPVVSLSRDEGELKAATLLEFDTASGTKKVVLRAQNGFTQRAITTVASFRQNGVSFSDINCMGQAYVFALHGFPNAIWAAATVIGTDTLRKLYIATSQVTEEPTLNSELFNGSCGNFSFTDIMVPAELVNGDLDTTIPPPFSLEVSP